MFSRKKHFKASSSHYDVLGIKKSASQEEIRNAFVSLSKIVSEKITILYVWKMDVLIDVTES